MRDETITLRRMVALSSKTSLVLSLAVALGGCSSSDTGQGGAGGKSSGTAPPTYPDPTPLAPLTEAPLTTETRLQAVQPQGDGAFDPRAPDDIEALLSQGYGDETTIAGEPVETRTLDGSAAPAEGPNAKLLARFVHLSDTQLADDESPDRVCSFDTRMGPTSGAYRPQEGHECRILNAAVRTINKLNESEPLDFVVLGGDNSDNAQSNEVDWFTAILDGDKRVECDSGDDNDPIVGAANDPKDSFFAEGLKMPWFWVSGNHDVLSQGNYVLTDILQASAVGSQSDGGTRDWSRADGPLKTGEVIADPRRAPLVGADLLRRVQSKGDGHGVDQAAIDYGRCFYSFDVGTSNLRVVVMDTASPTGSSDGLITQTDVDQMLVPMLDQAMTDGKIVIVTSHHSSTQLTDGSGAFGTKHDDALLGPAFQNVLGAYPNVLMHLAGHTHHHKVAPVSPSGGGHYWEMETAALADYPNQMRVVEVWDLDNGNYGIKGIALDYSVENDEVAADGRKRGVADYTSGWQKDGSGTVDDRNVELVIPKP